MFEDRADSLDFRDRVLAVLRRLGRREDMIWKLSPDFDGVRLHLPTDGCNHARVRGRLDGEGFRVRERGESEDGDWIVLGVHP